MTIVKDCSQGFLVFEKNSTSFMSLFLRRVRMWMPCKIFLGGVWLVTEWLEPLIPKKLQNKMQKARGKQKENKSKRNSWKRCFQRNTQTSSDFQKQKEEKQFLYETEHLKMNIIFLVCLEWSVSVGVQLIGLLNLCSDNSP